MVDNLSAARALCTEGPPDLRERAARAIAERLPPALLSLVTQLGVTIRCFSPFEIQPSSVMSRAAGADVALFEASELQHDLGNNGGFDEATLEITVKNWNDYGPGQFESVVIHEVMHAIDRALASDFRLSGQDEFWALSESLKKQKRFPTAYAEAESRASETFAEAGAIYFGPHVARENGESVVRTREDLAREHPGLHAFFARLEGSSPSRTSQQPAADTLHASVLVELGRLRKDIRTGEVGPTPFLQARLAKAELAAARLGDDQDLALTVAARLSLLLESGEPIVYPGGQEVDRQLLELLRDGARRLAHRTVSAGSMA